VPDERSKLVYSTDQKLPLSDKVPKTNSGGKASQAGLSPGQQKVTVRLDRKGRGGKSVSVIEGLPMAEKERETLLRQLKARLGTGGTVRDTALEIQGDHCDALMAALEKAGYRPKRSGG
jgi:translation initiation factor 1